MQKNLLKNIDGKIDEKKKLKEKIISHEKWKKLQTFWKISKS